MKKIKLDKVFDKGKIIVHRKSNIPVTALVFIKNNIHCGTPIAVCYKAIDHFINGAEAVITVVNSTEQ